MAARGALWSISSAAAAPAHPHLTLHSVSGHAPVRSITAGVAPPPLRRAGICLHDEAMQEDQQLLPTSCFTQAPPPSRVEDQGYESLPSSISSGRRGGTGEAPCLEEGDESLLWRRSSHSHAGASSAAAALPRRSLPGHASPAQAPAALVHSMQQLARQKNGGSQRQARAHALLQQLGPQLGVLPPRDLAALAWALGQLRLAVPAAWQAAFMGAAAAQLHVACDRPESDAFDGWAFATLLSALPKLGWRPPAGERWVGDCLAAMQPRLLRFDSRALASIAAALPSLLAPHDRPVPQQCAASFYTASLQRLPTCAPLGLARMLHGVAHWGVEVPAAWLAPVLQALQRAAPQLKPPEVAMSLHALLRLQQQRQGQRSQGQQPDAGSAELEHMLATVPHTLLAQAASSWPSWGAQDLSVLLFSAAQLELAPEAEWLEGMLGAVQQALPRFNARELATTLTALPALGAAPPGAWMGAWCAACEQLLPRLSTEDTACVLCALARLRHVPSADWYERLLVHAHGQLPGMSAQQLTGCAWALGRLALLPSREDESVALQPAPAWLAALFERAVGSLGGCSAEKVVRLVWAAAALRFVPFAVGGSGMVATDAALLQRLAAAAPVGALPAGVPQPPLLLNLQPPLPEQDQQPLIQQQQQQALEVLPVHWVALLLQAWGLLGHEPPPALLHALLMRSCSTPRLHAAPAADVAFLLLGVSQLQRRGCAPPEGWLEGAAGAAGGKLGELGAAQLAQLAGACAALGCAPQPPAALYAAVDQLLPSLDARQLSTLLWAAGRLALQPPSGWLEGMLSAARGKLGEATPQSLALTLHGLARLGYLPTQDWMAEYLMASHRLAATTGAHSSLIMLWALGRLKLHPGRRWIKPQLLLLHQQTPRLAPRDAAVLLVALARLRCRPSGVYLQRLLDQRLQGSFAAALRPHDAVAVLWALATLCWRPREDWLASFAAALPALLPAISARQLACVLWALGRLGLAAQPAAWRGALLEQLQGHVAQMGAHEMSLAVWGAAQLQLLPQPPQQQRPQQRRRACAAQQVQQLEPQLQQPGHQKDASQPAEQGEEQPQQRGQPPAGDDARERFQQLVVSRALQLQGSATSVGDLPAKGGSPVEGSFTAGALLRLLHGLATLQLRPGQTALSALLAHSACARLGALSGERLALLLWCLGQLGYRAEAAWMQQAEELLETKWLEGEEWRVMAGTGLAMLRAQQLG